MDSLGDKIAPADKKTAVRDRMIDQKNEDIEKFVITNQDAQKRRHNSINRLSKAVDIPFDDNITQLISGDKVIFIDYDSETAVVIESKRFAHFQKSIFKLLFKKL